VTDDDIAIEFTRFSAFYSPLIATIAGGFLSEEGLRPKHSVAPPGKSAIEALMSGAAHVAQSAPSQGFGPLERGQRPPALHFAQINEKDGFFLTARTADPSFTWDRLKGRRGEHDRAGAIVASVGDAIGACAFSSLAATREWLRTDTARRFMRAYRKARAWLIATPAATVAETEASFFPGIDRAVLAATIAAYQKLGCWTPHVEITRPAFEATLEVFRHATLITKHHAYEDVVASPPDAA
jgi:NitT/TauT family transport system substrate-binding protein